MNTTSWQKLAQMWLNERSRWGMTLDCPGGPEMYCNHKRPCKKFRWQKRRPGTCGSGNWSDMATSKEKLETTRSWRVRDSALEPPGGTALLTPWLQSYEAHLTLLASEAQDGQADCFVQVCLWEFVTAAVRNSPRSHYQSYSGYPWRTSSGRGERHF